MSTYDELAKLEIKSPILGDSDDQNHPTQKVAYDITHKRGMPRGGSSENARKKNHKLPTRNEIQEFSFGLRDQLKVKVQAEVPHRWQKELEDIARELNVKKLELYRFIIGEFIGKVKRKKII